MTASNNMAIWSELSKTDPAHTKQFKRAGGFSGTALKPMWVWKLLTEKFGPCGIGWGMSEPVFQVVQGINHEVLVYCTVQGWHETRDNCVYGVGGDKVIAHVKANEKFNRPERWENDDEAFKKAFTDALMNAFKFIGAGADIHMGLFDDSKYVAEVAEEFQERADEEAERQPRRKLDGPITSITGLEKALRAAKGDMDKAKDEESFEAVVTKHRPLFKQAVRDAKSWMEGFDDWEGFTPYVTRRRAEFNPPSGPEVDLKAEFPDKHADFYPLALRLRSAEAMKDAEETWIEDQTKRFKLPAEDQASLELVMAGVRENFE